MKKIEEIIFYRIYIAYLKKGDSAKFASCLYIAFIYIFLLAPIYGLLINLLKGISEGAIKFLYVIYLTAIVFIVFRKYYSKSKFEKIFSDNRIKKLFLPTWFYFFVLPLSMIYGVGLYILLSIHVLQRFNLEGMLYDLFTN